ncbi:Adrenodoxin, mitochondrial [Seminavis robusta]|uniref:Adrenodoxin, mitochondrial n=1 Tax=Seminavis robusta TaxID=568900 RepID=A0A9N8F3I6_9STRA|nr:Adrenodoxin, mitochondrial [Seminavis robusta]|eukprot:Sro2982_g341550.1 Adrenodoxin, mitochondrial (167) ;mRNA; f:5023-5979
MKRLVTHPSIRRRLSSGVLHVGFRGNAAQVVPSSPAATPADLLHQWQARTYSTTRPTKMAETVSITYVEADGTEREVQAELGKNLLDVAHDNNVELEGACGGELACSTCHLVFEQEIYDTLPEKDDDEEDMLDLAFELTETSRLGCQILVTENFDGMKVKIPDDGF